MCTGLALPGLALPLYACTVYNVHMAWWAPALSQVAQEHQHQQQQQHLLNYVQLIQPERQQQDHDCILTS
jgi:hypothetical protein